MTTVITSGSTLAIGPGAKLQGGSIANTPSYIKFSQTTQVSRYDGPGATTATWTNSLGVQIRALGIDLANGKVFASGNGGLLRKIDVATGATDWSINLDAGSYINGPKIAVDQNGDVYAALLSDPQQTPPLGTKKIDGATGNVIWTSSTTYHGGRSTIYSQAENAVYTCHQDSFDSGLTKYDASTGVQIWNKNASDVLVSNGGSPARPTDGVLLPNGNIALATNGSSGSGNQGHFFVLNASTGAEIVNERMNAPHSAGFITADATHVYISAAGSGSYLYAWEHDGSNPVTNTNTIFGSRQVGYRTSQNQAYITNATTGNVEAMTATGSGITVGDSNVGTAGFQYNVGPIYFLD